MDKGNENAFISWMHEHGEPDGYAPSQLRLIGFGLTLSACWLSSKPGQHQALLQIVQVQQY
jgi:hypothetical protein